VRRGINPSKRLPPQAKRPERITLAMLTHAPFIGGYHAAALDVVAQTLDSLRASVRTPCDLLVFDNGSCAELRNLLLERQDRGQIQYLLLSEHNLGKCGAWNVIFAAAPGELIAYCDQDVRFSPGWLERSLAILDAFPDAAMISARPMRPPAELSSATLAWAARSPDVAVEAGTFVSWETEWEMMAGLGLTEAQARSKYAQSGDVRLTRAGISALAGASHWQFLTRRDLVRTLPPLEGGRPLGDAMQLDRAVNAAGFLRLMTCEPLVTHVGNTIGGDAAVPGRPPRRAGRRLLDRALVRRGLLWIHDRIFDLYH
jgi:glycosyltransferase involved in cell wall biosynthesis